MIGPAILILALGIGSANALEIRGAVATESFVWNPQNFAGFDHDIDHDIGYETLTTRLTEGNKLSGDTPYGIVYTGAKKPSLFLMLNRDMSLWQIED